MILKWEVRRHYRTIGRHNGRNRQKYGRDIGSRVNMHIIYYTRGISVGIHPVSLPEACLHIINSSRANIVIVEDDIQLQKILKVKDQAPILKFIIQYTGNPTDPSVLNVSENIILNSF